MIIEGSAQAGCAQLLQVPFGNGHAYQNYIDKEQPNWLYAYYGENVERLRKVKAKYDPDNIWKFEQSIPPA